MLRWTRHRRYYIITSAALAYLHSSSVRWSPILIALIYPCASCSSIATQSSAARATSSLGAHSSAPVRRVFTSRLSAVGEAEGTVQPAVASRAWGTVKLVLNDDDTLEYLITIYNPKGETFTGAQLCQGAGSAVGPALATLFTEVTLRDRYVQLRGTVAVGRDTKPSSLAEALQERPSSFYVAVQTRQGVNGIRGSVE